MVYRKKRFNDKKMDDAYWEMIIRAQRSMDFIMKPKTIPEIQFVRGLVGKPPIKKIYRMSAAAAAYTAGKEFNSLI